jgi:two-component system, OmpR family, sensor histidine kinase SenX3
VHLTVAGERNCRVLGSERQLITAIGNLVENAIIYSDRGARVAVAAHRVVRGEDETIEITVSDNGIGISQADLGRIFERFYRVDYARSRSNGGTGLGLSIVKHIAAAHGGAVSVWSQLGQGSTFTVSLPGPATSDQPVILTNTTISAGSRELSGRSDTGPISTRPSRDGRLRGDAEPVHRRTPQTQEINR